jgi:hypothetical protein
MVLYYLESHDLKQVETTQFHPAAAEELAGHRHRFESRCNSTGSQALRAEDRGQSA